MPDAKSFGINTDKKEVVEDEVVNEEVSDEVEEEQEDLVEETFEL